MSENSKPQYEAELLPNKAWHITLDDVPVTEDHMESLIYRLNVSLFIAPEDLAHYKMMQEAWCRFGRGDITLMRLKGNLWQASINLSAMLSHAATAFAPWEAVMKLEAEMKRVSTHERK